MTLIIETGNVCGEEVSLIEVNNHEVTYPVMKLKVNWLLIGDIKTDYFQKAAITIAS